MAACLDRFVNGEVPIGAVRDGSCGLTCGGAGVVAAFWVGTELPPVPWTPRLRWPPATGKDVRHATTPPA